MVPGGDSREDLHPPELRDGGPVGRMRKRRQADRHKDYGERIRRLPEDAGDDQGESVECELEFFSYRASSPS